MAGPLPHSAQIQELADNFLTEISVAISEAHDTLKRSVEFRKIYRVSLATDAVLSKLLAYSKCPPPHAARAIVKSVPLLVSTRQLGSARIELRRFMELAVWDLYYQDHPIEWERFKSNPTHGFTRDDKDPIEYCAHRELEYYLNYAKSRVSAEPSRLAGQAVEELRSLKGELNEAVHPGLATSLIGHHIPLDTIDEPSLKDLVELQRSVFKSCCVLIASVRRRRFDRLPPMHRAHFDWLLGNQLAKKVRSGPFGL
jgi:hypothetical protein